MITTRHHSSTFKIHYVLPLLLALSVLGGAAETNMAERNNAFACDLYARLKTQPGNLFLSPCSISTCLAITYAGARGDTARQMARVLHLGSNPAQVHASFEQRRKQLNSAAVETGVELNIANALWAQVGPPFLPEFLDVASGQYGAHLNQVDFETQADSAVRDINSWTSLQTHGRIQHALSLDSVDDYTSLVLVNAIYFKGTWSTPFKIADTKPAPFHLSQSRQTNVPLMYRLDKIRYAEKASLQAVELQYSGLTFSMVVFLPRQIEGLKALEAGLTPGFVASWLRRMTSRKVELYLPRFKLESTFALSNTLSQMGMPDAFLRKKADFSGMDGVVHNLHISFVSHKAWGEVNEQGTEAAAATGVGVRRAGIEKPPPPPPIFRADHPFLFFILDRQSGTILFIGRFAAPEPTSR